MDEKFANMTFADLEQLLTAAQAAEYLATLGIEISVDRLRGLARKGKVPGAGVVMKKPAFTKQGLEGWTPPVSAGIAPKREDGRRPYKIYLLEKEKVELVEAGFEFKVPSPRKQKGAVKAAVEQTDPFEAFGA